MWKEERALAEPIPLPGRYYCSPLTRVLQTFERTFADVAGFDFSTSSSGEANEGDTTEKAVPPAHNNPIILEVR